MNICEYDVLNKIRQDGFTNQRALAETVGYSVGAVNHAIKNLVGCGYLDNDCRPTAQALALFEQGRPRRAVILAAGYGMRMVPINVQ